MIFDSKKYTFKEMLVVENRAASPTNDLYVEAA